MGIANAVLEELASAEWVPEWCESRLTRFTMLQSASCGSSVDITYADLRRGFSGTMPDKACVERFLICACIRRGARGRFFNVVDLVNKLEAEARAGRQGRIADHLTRLDFVVLDELGYLPFAQSGGQLLFDLISRLYERTS